MKPAPRKVRAISGVMMSAPRYAPMVPRSANSLLPSGKEKWDTATAGGTAARSDESLPEELIFNYKSAQTNENCIVKNEIPQKSL